MKKLIRLIIPILMVLGIAGGSLAAAAPASAATCKGNLCRGQDPLNTGCSGDAVTIGWASVWEVRYSNACQAVWVRTGQRWLNTKVGIFDRYYNQGRPTNEWVFNRYDWLKGGYASGGPSWTPMIPMDSYQAIQLYLPEGTSAVFDTYPV